MATTDEVMAFESNNDVTSFRTHDDATFRSKVEEIVLNADAGLGDVYLVSQDRKYFLAHRIVLVRIWVIEIICDTFFALF